jgi:FkbM family methyltransferase
MQKGRLSERIPERSGVLTFFGSDSTKKPSFFISSDQVMFLLQDTAFRQIFEVQEYRFDNIRPDDHVIDIGANVGAFCIRASRISQYIVAVEPVTASLLRQNIQLNGVPVRVIEGALGDGNPKKVRWDDCEVISATYTLRKIIEMAEGCDFLKCDCEGAEWQIVPEDLNGIRHIEMELHIPPIGGPPNPALLDYLGRHYHFGIERKPVHTALGVMGVLHAERNE